MEEIKQPPAPVPVPAAPIKKKMHTSGIMPGQLTSGIRTDYLSAKTSENTHQQTLDEVKAMDGKELRQWLKKNGDRLQAALRWKNGGNR